MTTDTDKLVEMALKSGAVNHFVQGLPDRYAFSLGELAAFRDRIVASLCADVEPFWHAVISHRAPIVNKAVRSRDVAEEYAEKCSENYPGVEVIPLVPASTVASLTAQRDAALARVAELEKDAARYRWLRSVPNAFKAQRIVNDTPHGMDATIDAAMNGGNQ